MYMPNDTQASSGQIIRRIEQCVAKASTAMIVIHDGYEQRGRRGEPTVRRHTKTIFVNRVLEKANCSCAIKHKFHILYKVRPWYLSEKQEDLQLDESPWVAIRCKGRYIS